jgi:replicative DNA helicase
MLAAMLNSTVKVGAVSLEDGPDVVGTRLLSALTGIDSLRIRRKALSKGDLAQIALARKAGKLSHMHFTYPIAGNLAQVEAGIVALTNVGCRMIWVDYLQEISGNHKYSERRNEVSDVFRTCHRRAAEGNAALMMVSQFRRPSVDAKTGNARPAGIHHLKESGDLENKARIIVIAQKQPSPDAEDRVRFKLAKSTYGGEYVKWDMVRDESGTLRDAQLYDPTEGF